MHRSIRRQNQFNEKEGRSRGGLCKSHLHVRARFESHYQSDESIQCISHIDCLPLVFIYIISAPLINTFYCLTFAITLSCTLLFSGGALLYHPIVSPNSKSS